MFRRLCAKVRHSEPRLRARKRTQRIEAAAEVVDRERDIRDCLWGHDPHYGVEI
jgi:hypothetical protein